MKHPAGTWSPDDVEICQKMGAKMKQKVAMHPDGGVTLEIQLHNFYLSMHLELSPSSVPP